MGACKWNCINAFYLYTFSLFIALRLISYGFTTDLQEVMAMSHQSEAIRIYSNSWGPYTYAVGGPGPLLQKMFEVGVQQVYMHELYGLFALILPVFIFTVISVFID